MKLISCHRGELQTSIHSELNAHEEKGFVTGLEGLDRLLPAGGFAWGAIHELLGEERMPLFVAAMLARAALVDSKARRHEGTEARSGDEGDRQCGTTEGPSIANCKLQIANPETIEKRKAKSENLSRCMAWCDPGGRLYPPALAAAGISLDRLYLLTPANPADELWALGECLRCRGVRVTVGQPPRMSRIGARRLQLAAEDGGGVGILLRREKDFSAEYAAATRWLVQSLPGERTVQRWKLQLIHGHGGRVGQGVILEACRATDHVRVLEAVADRPVEKERIRQGA